MWYGFFHVYSQFVDVSFLNGPHPSAVDGENFPRLFILSKKNCNFLVGGRAFILVCSFLGLVALLLLILPPQKTVSWCMWNGIYFYLILGFLNGMPASPGSGFYLQLYPTVQMSSAMPNTFGRLLKISSFFLWNHCLLVLFQRIVKCVCTCQKGIQMWLNMRIF